MKKVVRLLIISLLTVAAALSLVACNGINGNSQEKGIIAKKLSGDSFYTVIGYGAEDDVKSLDIAAAVKEKYGDVVVGRIRTGSFDGNSSLTEIIVKDTTEDGTLTIDKGAFKNMLALKKITLPFVGANAYSDAYYNETAPALGDELKATDNERLFGYIFGEEVNDTMAEIKQSNGTSDATFYIPATLKEITVNAEREINIPMYSFCGISGIATVNLQGSIKAIGVAAFKNAIGLKKINIPASVKVIYDSAFEGAISLKSFDANGFSIAAASELTEIKENAFKNTRLTSFDLSGTKVEAIGDYAFFGSSLTTFTFSEQISVIGVYAFANNKNLSVVKPDCAIGVNAFIGTLSE